MSKNPPLDDIPEEAAFLVADRAADRATARLARAFSSVIEEARTRIHEAQLTLAAEYGDPSFALSLVASFGLESAISDAVQSAQAKADGDSALDEAILAGISLGLSILNLDATPEEREAMIQRARMAVASEVSVNASEVAKQSALALALAVLLVYRRKVALPEQADRSDRVFRASTFRSIFGLNRPQTQAAIGGAQSALFAGVATGVVRRRLLGQAARLLVERSELFARTIAERAINLAQQSVIEQAVEAGAIDPSTQARQWVSRGDGLVCPRCSDFHLVVAKINEPFRSRRGEVAWVPDIHPRGRCRFRIISIQKAAA